ncbi:putative Zinc finger, LIM-type, protein DA1 [Plasmopara halstedii]
MTWTCMHCTLVNNNDTSGNCEACNAIRVLQCPSCKGEIKYGRRLNVNGKTYHPDCFCCTGCKRPLPSRFQIVNGGNYHPECAPKPKIINKTTTFTKTSINGHPEQNENHSSNTNVKLNHSINSNGTKHTSGGWNCSTCTFYNANGLTPTCEVCNSIRIMICPGCKGEIKVGQRVNVDGKVYHPDCFRCTACNGNFTTNKFQVKDGGHYHHECYKQLFHPRCNVCEDFIAYEPGTQKISFKVMPFGGEKYCAKHDNCDRCCSCQRVEPVVPGREFHRLSDGRKICCECCNYVVLDSNEARDVVKEVWEFMHDLGISLPEIPVYLVESSVLKEQCNAHKKTNALANDKTHVEGHVTRGLCLSEVSQIQHMVRSGKKAVPHVVSIEKTRSVNAILILHGLPYDLTASILAHEATHAFIKLSDNFPDKIPPKVEEGICQLMSYLFLKYKQMMKSDELKKRTYESRLRKFYMHQLKHDTSPVYGDGFREAYEAYRRVSSLQRMFDSIRHSATFP